MPEWIETIDEQLTSSLSELEVDIQDVTAVEIIAKKGQHTLYRITCAGTTRVVKWFADAEAARELAIYRLLHYYGVPTLPVYAISNQAVLMDDLTVSAVWRLATVYDIEREETGVAVAPWYRALHAAGSRVLQDGTSTFLTREVDALTPASVMATGERLGLAHLPVWQFAVEHLEPLTHAFRTYPETLNYNDFHWTNLALSREKPLRAIVFDYHMLGLGPAYCDIRNVCGSLGERARSAFRDAYGPVDEHIATLDAPLSLLYSLQVAAHLPQVPGWVKGCLQRVTKGEFEVQLNTAVETVLVRFENDVSSDGRDV